MNFDTALKFCIKISMNTIILLEVFLQLGDRRDKKHSSLVKEIHPSKFSQTVNPRPILNGCSLV